MTQYRFYSFVPALYISPLQCGLQTAHAVSEMHSDLMAQALVYKIPPVTEPRKVYNEWAKYGKTIIICNALNHAGVEEAYDRLTYFAELFELPVTIFHEDEQSLNGAATAAAIIVPEQYFDAKPYVEYEVPGFWAGLFKNKQVEKRQGFEYTAADGTVSKYEFGSQEAEFIKFLKSYRLA